MDIFDSLGSVLTPEGTGAASVLVVGAIWKGYQKLRQYSIKSKKNDIEEKLALTEQFEVLLKESNAYRIEVREDLVRLRKEFDTIKSRYEKDIEEIRIHYESEMETMREQVNTLTEEVKKYRQENGALHLLLRERGIEIPSWINTEK